MIHVGRDQTTAWCAALAVHDQIVAFDLDLDAVVAGKGKRGRKRTPQSIAGQIHRIDQEILDAPPIKKLELIQKKTDLLAEKERLTARVDIALLEKNFVKVAKSYANRNGITYSSFRALGVSAEVLKKAGIPRTRG